MAEANALATLARSAAVFPADVRDRINDAVREYVHAVVDDEWPSMRRGESSSRAAAALEGLYAAYQNLTPQTAIAQSAYGSSVSDLREVTLARRQRLLQSQVGLPSLLRVLLVVGGVVFAYLLTMVLDYPFSGDLSVDTTPFKQGALARYFAYDGPPPQLEPEMVGRLTPQDLVGVWNSDSAFGVMVFREVGGEIHGAYRNDGGTIVGLIGDDGVFRGW